MPISKMNHAELLDYLENLHAPNDGSLPSDLKSKEGNWAARKLVRECIMTMLQLIAAYSRALVLDDSKRPDLSEILVNHSIKLSQIRPMFEVANFRSTKLIYYRLEEIASELVRILVRIKAQMNFKKSELVAFDDALVTIRSTINKFVRSANENKSSDGSRRLS